MTSSGNRTSLPGPADVEARRDPRQDQTCDCGVTSRYACEEVHNGEFPCSAKLPQPVEARTDEPIRQTAGWTVADGDERPDKLIAYGRKLGLPEPARDFVRSARRGDSAMSGDVEARLAEIEARAKAATSGPWRMDGGAMLTPEGYVLSGTTLPRGWNQLSAGMANADFIAHAREDVPWLLARLKEHDERQQRERETSAPHSSVAEVSEWCREDLPNGERCHGRAEVILWGKLISPEGLGPRCFTHAAKHVGSRSVHDPAWAIFDLRGLAREATYVARSGGDQ